MVASRQGLVVAAHAPGALVAPGPRPDAERRDGDVGAGQLDALVVLGTGLPSLSADRACGPGQVALDGRPPLGRVRELR